MAAANASLRVRCDHWKIAVARAERRKMRDHKVCPSVLQTAKNRLVRGQVCMEHEEELQSCRKTGEHEPLDW